MQGICFRNKNTIAFGNIVVLTVDSVNIRATCASALPTHSRSSWGPHSIYSAILCIALNPQSGDFSGAILGVRSVALLHGKIGEGIREVKESAILTKRTFSISAFFGRSLVHPLFVLGYLHGSTKDGTSRRNLNKSAKVHCVECRA